MGNSYSTIMRRIILFTTLFVLGWVVIIARLFIIQVVESKKYQEKCNIQANLKKEVPPLRGTFYDRNGKALTLDLISYNIAAHPYLIEDKPKLARSLALDIDGDAQKYLNLLLTNKTFVWLERNVTQERFQNYDRYEKLPGLVIEKKILRYYPLGEIMGQVLGFTNSDNHGASGLELGLESHLGGKPGWLTVQKDGLGRVFVRPDLPSKEAIDGNDVVLTIDQGYQAILFEELTRAREQNRAERAMGVVINPNTGEILAMATVPSFDPNRLGAYPQEYMRNAVVSDIYEPGSTFKVVTATAALERRVLTPERKIDCNPGYIQVANRIIRDHDRYSVLTFAEVIKNSSNVGTIKVAQAVGKEQVFNYLRKYGFGVRTDIQFPGEVSGILHPLKNWTDLTLAQVAIGQGIAVTALQVAYAYAAIANGGVLLKPLLVKQIRTKDGICLFDSKPIPIRQVASAETMAILRELLRLTVASGTGRNADIRGLTIAGKTGTAQKVVNGAYSQNEYFASFVGFFPVAHPKILCIVVLDNPRGSTHTGGGSAAPVVREIFKRIVNESDELFLDEEELPVNPPKYAMTVMPTTAHSSAKREVMLASVNQTPLMPDVTGKTLRQALSILQQVGIENVAIEGTGVVVMQAPAPNTPLSSATPCHLRLKPIGVQID
jgi:cell division protein FtsI (penicillin-binding protein 3)